MTMTDPIADMLTRIRNGNDAFHEVVDVPSSKQKLAVAAILKQEGYIEDYESVQAGPGQAIRVRLKYGPDRERMLSGLRRVSRPGRRVYAVADRLPKVLGGMGTAIMSTSKGLMTDKQAARSRMGGEVVAYIW